MMKCALLLFLALIISCGVQNPQPPDRYHVVCYAEGVEIINTVVNGYVWGGDGQFYWYGADGKTHRVMGDCVSGPSP